jgi:hypothetical protein
MKMLPRKVQARISGAAPGTGRTSWQLELPCERLKQEIGVTNHFDSGGRSTSRLESRHLPVGIVLHRLFVYQIRQLPKRCKGSIDISHSILMIGQEFDDGSRLQNCKTKGSVFLKKHARE